MHNKTVYLTVYRQMPLTVKDIRDAEPRDKQYKLTDRDGLYVLVHPNGGKYFRYDYRFGGKRKTLGLGTFPETSLRQAREALHEATSKKWHRSKPYPGE